jgi:3-phosphoshikimate 1-carboxyvinyltransferase
VVRGFLSSADCLHTLQAVTALGADARLTPDGELQIHGTGGRVLQPVGPLDLGNSGTGIRLLTGLLSGHPVQVTLSGDASLCSRPMGRIAEPLRAMGARIELTGDRGTAPIQLSGGRLRGVDYTLPVASAQVKSAILLAALWAEGRTRVTEPAPTRDHTERLLVHLGLPLTIEGPTLLLEGFGPAGPGHAGGTWTVPGDFSSAAFWLVAAAARPGAEVTVRDVGLNPRRTALLDVLRRMGADLRVVQEPGSDTWEPFGEITVRGAALRGTVISGAEIPNVIDELPLIAVAAALAEGDTLVRDAAELKVKESDRIATVTDNLRRIGVDAEARPDGFRIRGGARLIAGARLESFGDHRIAMALGILSGSAPGPTTICGAECTDTSYPGFWEDLTTLGGVVYA